MRGTEASQTAKCCRLTLSHTCDVQKVDAYSATSSEPPLITKGYVGERFAVVRGSLGSAAEVVEVQGTYEGPDGRQSRAQQ